MKSNTGGEIGLNGSEDCILKQEEKRTWVQMEPHEFSSRKLREFPSDAFYFLQEVGGESSAQNAKEVRIFEV